MATATAESPPISNDELAARLTALVRTWYDHGWAPATSTNYSFRDTAGDGFWVSRSGVDKAEFAATDFVAVDPAGRPKASSAAKVSAETGLHAALYARDADIACIVHTHSPAGTVLSRLAQRQGGAVRLAGYELLKAFHGVETHATGIEIPVVDNDQDIGRLAEAIAAALDQGPAPAVLIAGHGAYTWGADVGEAKRHLEALEFLLACELSERQSER